MLQKIPPPPPIADENPELNRWLIELTSILNADGGIDASLISPPVAPIASPVFTGVPEAPTAPNGTNTTQLATTAFVLANSNGTPWNATPEMDGAGAPGVSQDYARGDHVHPSDTSRAPTVSPTFTGTATFQGPLQANVSVSVGIPNASAGGQINMAGATSGVQAWVPPAIAAATTIQFPTVSGTLAVLNSPGFTGTPTAPTATAGTNTTQLATTAFVAGQTRFLLAANANYYVSAATGSDSNNGTSAGTPFATIQHALNVVGALDFGIFNVTVNVANGTQNESITLPSIVGSGTLTLLGNAASPSSVTINGGANNTILFNAGTAGSFVVNGFTLTNTGGRNCFVNGGPGSLVLENIVWAASSLNHLQLNTLANVSFNGSTHTVSAGTSQFFDARRNAVIDMLSATIVFPTAITFTASFIAMDQGAVCRAQTVTYTNPGNVTGTKYILNTCAVLDTNGALNVPGTVTVAPTNGAQYT